MIQLPLEKYILPMENKQVTLKCDQGKRDTTNVDKSTFGVMSQKCEENK